MYGKKYNDENRNDQQRVMGFFIDRFIRPRQQLFHFARRIKGRGGRKNYTDLLSVCIESDDVVGQRNVRPAVALIFGAMAQQGLVDLA